MQVTLTITFDSPAEKVDVGEVQRKYKLQPKHPPQNHTVWHQTIVQVLYTTEQKPIQVSKTYNWDRFQIQK